MLGVAAILFSFGWTIKALVMAACAIAILYGNLNFSFERKDLAEAQRKEQEAAASGNDAENNNH